MPNKSRKPGCEPCKERHLKCDHVQPKCGNCLRSRKALTCTYVGSHNLSQTASHEGSRRLSGTDFNFACYTTKNTSLHESQAIPQDEFVRSRDIHHEQQDLVSPETPGLSSVSNANQYTSSLPGIVDSHPRDWPDTHWIGAREQVSTAWSQDSDTDGIELQFYNGNRATTGNTISPTDANMFRYYCSYVGNWLDIVSPSQHFSMIVPTLALSSPALYHACLRYASHVKMLKGELEQSIEEEYSNRAIQVLIGALGQAQRPSEDQNLMATVILLRTSEQFAEVSEDRRHHFEGAWSLFAAEGLRWSPFQIDLRGVAFWIFVRENIHLSLLTETAFRFNIDSIHDDKPWSPAADETWTNRMTSILARTCLACFSRAVGDHQKSLDQIRRLIDIWIHSIPNTFQPWYINDGEFELFPEMYFLKPCHEVAWQQYYTAKVLIAAHARAVSSKSQDLAETTKRAEVELIEPTRKLCGICISSPCTGSKMNGAYYVAWCGRFFSGKTERKRIVDWLQGLTQDTKWPVKTCIERLQQKWA